MEEIEAVGPSTWGKPAPSPHRGADTGRALAWQAIAGRHGGLLLVADAGQFWAEIKTAVGRDSEFGRELALACASEPASPTIIDRLDDARIADLYRWLTGLFPASVDHHLGEVDAFAAGVGGDEDLELAPQEALLQQFPGWLADARQHLSSKALEFLSPVLAVRLKLNLTDLVGKQFASRLSWFRLTSGVLHSADWMLTDVITLAPTTPELVMAPDILGIGAAAPAAIDACAAITC